MVRADRSVRDAEQSVHFPGRLISDIYTYNADILLQYFLWYLTILPLVLPSLTFTWSKGTTLIGAWVGAQALWLKFAYDLEFLKQEVHYTVWTCSLVFLAVNLWILTEIVFAYRWNPSPFAVVSAKDESKKRE